MVIFDPANGKLLWSYDTARPYKGVNGVAGHGGAEKDQVQRMVRMILGVREAIAADAADALAAALCHAHERGVRGALHALAKA